MKMLSSRTGLFSVVMALAAAATLVMSGCAKTAEESTATTFTEVYNASFSVTCVNCHTPGGSSNTTLDFSSADTAYATLVGVAVSGPSSISTCGGVKRVAAGDATNSYLMGMLFTQDNRNNFGGSTNCQPPTNHRNFSNLSDAERTSIAAWINAGAAR